MYLQDISVLHRVIASPEEFATQSSQVKAELKTLSPAIFKYLRQMNQLVKRISKEATLSTMAATDSYDKLDALEWQSDLYKQLLLEEVKKSLSKTPSVKFNNTTCVINSFKWRLMFWSNEEFKLGTLSWLRYSKVAKNTTQNSLNRSKLWVSKTTTRS